MIYVHPTLPSASVPATQELLNRRDKLTSDCHRLSRELNLQQVVRAAADRATVADVERDQQDRNGGENVLEHVPTDRTEAEPKYRVVVELRHASHAEAEKGCDEVARAAEVARKGDQQEWVEERWDLNVHAG